MNFEAHRVPSSDHSLQYEVGKLYLEKNPNVDHNHIFYIIKWRVQSWLMFLLKKEDVPVWTMRVQRWDMFDPSIWDISSEKIIWIKEITLWGDLDIDEYPDAFEKLLIACIDSSKALSFSGVDWHVNRELYETIDRDLWPILFEKIGFQKMNFGWASLTYWSIIFDNKRLW